MDNLHVKDKVSITQHVLFTAVGNLVRSALVNTDLYPNSHTLRYSSSLFALRDLETNWGSSDSQHIRERDTDTLNLSYTKSKADCWAALNKTPFSGDIGQVGLSNKVETIEPDDCKSEHTLGEEERVGTTANTFIEATLDMYRALRLKFGTT